MRIHICVAAAMAVCVPIAATAKPVWLTPKPTADRMSAILTAQSRNALLTFVCAKGQLLAALTFQRHLPKQSKYLLTYWTEREAARRSLATGRERYIRLKPAHQFLSAAMRAEYLTLKAYINPPVTAIFQLPDNPQPLVNLLSNCPKNQ